MNKNSVKDFRPEDGRMDKVREVLEEEGVYMGKGEGGFDIYHLYGCTVFVYEKKIRFGGELLVTIRHYKSRLEQKVGIKLKEIK